MIIIIWVYRQTNGKNIASTFIKNVNRYGNILIKKHLNNNNKTEFVKYANLKMLKNLNTGRKKKNRRTRRTVVLPSSVLINQFALIILKLTARIQHRIDNFYHTGDKKKKKSFAGREESFLIHERANEFIL